MMNDDNDPEQPRIPEVLSQVVRLEDYVDDPVPNTEAYAFAYRVGMFRAYLTPGFLQVIALNLGSDEVDRFVDEFAARFAARRLAEPDDGD